MMPKRVAVLDSDLVRRALVQCALPEGLEVTFAGEIDEVGDADVAIVAATRGLTAAEACRQLKKRMATVLCDERYADAELGQREAASCGAAAFVGAPFARETLTQAMADALAKTTKPADVAAAAAGEAVAEFQPIASDPKAKSPEQMWELFRQRVDSIYRNLDRLDHYQVLEISPQSSVQQIKLAYQMRVMEFHPDRFASHPNEDFRRKLYEITKAVTEALRVLSDPKLRQPYDAERRPRDRAGTRVPRLRPKKEQ